MFGSSVQDKPNVGIVDICQCLHVHSRDNGSIVWALMTLCKDSTSIKHLWTGLQSHTAGRQNLWPNPSMLYRIYNRASSSICLCLSCIALNHACPCTCVNIFKMSPLYPNVDSPMLQHDISVPLMLWLGICKMHHLCRVKF